MKHENLLPLAGEWGYARPMTHPNLALASRFIAAIEAGDIDAVAAIYAPDARIWLNTNGIDFPGQTVAENLKVLAWMDRFLKDKRYEIVARSPTETGFVQQHVLRATIAATGEAYAMPVCMVCTLVDGRITRLDEYMDSAHVAPLTAAAEALRAKKA